MRSAVVAAAVIVLTGCAHEFTGKGSQHVGVRAGPVNGVQAALYDTGLYGPNVAVRRGEMSFRGTLMNRVVDLSWGSGSEVRGMVDSGPTQLHWEPEGDGYRIWGLYGGKLSNLRITSAGIEGSIGGCGYHMTAGRRGYTGRALCLGGFDQDAQLFLPADLSGRAEGEQVALIALLLTGGSPRSQLDLARGAEAAGPGVDYYWRGGLPPQPGVSERW